MVNKPTQFYGQNNNFQQQPYQGQYRQNNNPQQIYQQRYGQNAYPQQSVPVAAENPNKGKSYFTGLIGALLGALLGAIPWAIVYYFGWFSAILGFVIGIAASKGYDIFRGKSSGGKIVIVLFSAIIGVLAGTLLGDCITVGVMIKTGEIANATLSDIPGIIITAIYTSSEYLGSFFLNAGLGVLFAILGMIGIFRQIALQNKQRKAGY